jgi:hypothetical protein
VQWVKKTVPEPLVPESGGSSPWWGKMLEMTGSPGAPQKPRSPSNRFTPQRRGHSSQRAAIRSSSWMRWAQSASPQYV